MGSCKVEIENISASVFSTFMSVHKFAVETKKTIKISLDSDIRLRARKAIIRSMSS